VEDPNLYVQVTADKEEAYVGEQITLIYEIYYRVGLVNLSFRQQPTTTGFWTEDLNSPGRLVPRERVIDGRRYRVALLKRFAAFPTTAGELTIGPLVVECEVRTRRRTRDPFDDFFRSPFDDMFGRTQTVIRRSKPVTINVRPLPPPGPGVEFSGAVGRYQIEASLDREDLRSNEAVTLRVRISGEGNIQTAADLELPDIPGVKVYDPQKRETTGIRQLKLLSEREYEFILQPRAAGVMVVPAIPFTYFDPKAGEYRSVRTQPLTLNVLPGEEEDTLFVRRNNTPATGVLALDVDVRYIKGAPESLRRGPFLDQRPTTRTLFALAPAFVLLVWLYRKRRDKLIGDQAYARTVRAWPRARKRLKAAAAALHGGQPREAAKEIRDAVLGYLADRLNLPEAGLIGEQLAEQLQSKGVAPELRRQLRELLQECDLLIFAPGQVDTDACNELLQRARALLKALARLRSLREAA
jgi:hypothetical protein